MVDKNTEQKLKRIWCERLLIFVCTPILIGFSVAKVQSTANYRTQMLTYEEKIGIKTSHIYEAVPMQEYEKLSKEGFVLSLRKLEPEKVVSKEGFVLVRKLEYESALDGGGSFRVLGFKLIKQQEYERILKLQHSRDEVQSKLMLEFFLLLALASGFIRMLVLLLERQNQVSLSLTGQLICFLPEECIGELEALHQQMKSEQRSIWLIRMIILGNFLELLWAFYVQIKIDNLRLPQNKGHKKN